MDNILFQLMVAILLLEYVLFIILEKLNLKAETLDLPKKLIGIYEPEEYKRSRNYENTNTRFGFISESFSLILILAFLFSGGFAWLDSFVRTLTENTLLITIYFVGILMFASDFLQIPFNLYKVFVIEEKFGFNKITPKLFLTDKIKSWILSIVLGGAMISAIFWFYETTAEKFWIYAWAFVAGISIFMSMFYSNLIVPLFNKQIPLEDGELRKAIEDFSKKAGFKLANIYVIDGSKRSTKANAYFTGLGPKKRIVLYDTLIETLEIQEIVAVLAHEIGHYKHKHTILGLIISLLQTGFMLFLLSLFIIRPEPAQALGVEVPNFHIGIIAFGMLYSPIGMLIGLITNLLSRKNEYQADAFAAKHQLGKQLISSLKKLSVSSLSNLTPHPAYVFFYYSHPSLLQRMNAIEKSENQ